MTKKILLVFIVSIIPMFLQAQGCDNFQILIQIYSGTSQQEIDELLSANNLVQSGELMLDQFIVAHRIGIKHKLYADSIEIQQLDSIITNLEKADNIVKSATKNSYYKPTYFWQPKKKNKSKNENTGFSTPIDSIKRQD